MIDPKKLNGDLMIIRMLKQNAADMLTGMDWRADEILWTAIQRLGFALAAAEKHGREALARLISP